jgi:hypothetical protein
MWKGRISVAVSTVLMTTSSVVETTATPLGWCRRHYSCRLGPCN